MHIEDISIVNFKNLKDVQATFSPRFNCLIGNNGAGKTNLMDAVYYLSFCKSFFNASDQFNIHHEEDFFMLNGHYRHSGTQEHITCGMQKGQKKQFKRNSKVYKKLMEHIGLIPLVMITPSDVSLILGGSEERRKFIDGVISQYNQGYLDDLLNYNRAMLQRNNLLKQFASNRYFDQELLSVWDEPMIGYGARIHNERSRFVEQLIPLFQEYYTTISGGKERVGLVHQSDLYAEPIDKLLKDNLAKDRTLQYTTTGIHKDDLLFTLDGYPVKKVASQGQKKTYLVALKLSQYDFIRELSGIRPILLLDDIFDKLDRQRVEQIIQVVTDDRFGQIFITDTNREHLDSIMREVDAAYRIFRVENGTLNVVE